MTRRFAWIALLVLLAVLGAGCFGRGNPNTSRITGTVVDAAQDGLKGATVAFGTWTTSSLADGSFSLAVAPGSGTLSVTKSGFVAYSKPVNVPAAGLSLEPIILNQNIPEYGGDFQGIIVPDFVGGSATFTVDAPASDSRTLVMLFPQAATDAEYTYSASFAPVAESSPRIVRTASKASRRANLRLSSALLFKPYPRAYAADQRMRETEKRAGPYRNAILEMQRRARALDSASLYVGQSRTFRVYDFVASDETRDVFYTVQAQLRASGQHALLYVKQGATVTDAQVQNLLRFFDDHQPTLVQTFGDELDVDGNRKTIVLVTPMPYFWGTLYGYFDPINEFSVRDDFNSNQADMIYINSELLASEFNTLKGTLAHEYQHLLHFSSRITNGEAFDDAWIDEGFSGLAEDVAGLGFLGGDTAALTVVEDWLNNGDPRAWQLTNWGGGNLDYGGDYLFARYFFDHYLASGTLQVNRSPYGGPKAVTDVTGGNFADVYRAFLASVAYAGYGGTPDDSRVGFTAPGFTLAGLEGVLRPIMPWDVDYNATTTIERRIPEDPTTQLTMYPWGFDSFSINGGEAGARVRVTLNTQVEGEFGAVVVTGLRWAGW